jgi:hypothetical protein
VRWEVLFELVATFSAGLFAGAAMYVTLVEHPARLECGTELAVTEFGPSYRRALSPSPRNRPAIRSFHQLYELRAQVEGWPGGL